MSNANLKPCAFNPHTFRRHAKPARRQSELVTFSSTAFPTRCGYAHELRYRGTPHTYHLSCVM
eukprot:5096841-Pyramimonas_sp.AAC.1